MLAAKPARFVIQLAPDWELYLDAIDWGHSYRWTDLRKEAWSWSNTTDPEPVARLARCRTKYPHAFFTVR